MKVEGDVSIDRRLFLSLLPGLELAEFLQDWVPLSEMLPGVQTNVLSVVLEDRELLVAFDVLNRVVGESKDLLGFLETILRPIVVVPSSSQSVLVSEPERDQTNYDLIDPPNWIPRLWVMMRDREADSEVELWVSAESSILGQHVDSWGLMRILIRASDLTQEESSLASGVLKAEDDEVPRVDVFWIWQADEIVSHPTVLFDLGVVLFLGQF